MTDYLTRTVDDKTMWLVTLPEIITDDGTREEENLVVILIREELWGPPSEHNPDGLYRASCIMTLYLSDDEQTKTQTFTANYWPQQGALHLFTEEFRLKACLQGRGLGTWITQQFVLWTRGLPPETWVCPIVISPVDEGNEENKTRRDSLWHAIGFIFSEDEQESRPLRVGELQWPGGRHSTLIAEPLPNGMLRLTSMNKTLRLQQPRSGRDTEHVQDPEENQRSFQLSEVIRDFLHSGVFWTAAIVSIFWLSIL